MRHKPHAACIVPERREERTTEGGLDAAGQIETLKPLIGALTDAGVRVSLFIAADARQLDAAVALGAPVVELHTGAYCEAFIDGDQNAIDAELAAIARAAAAGAEMGLEIHAGHGLTFDSVPAIAELPQIRELNIGHFLVGEAVFSGLDSAIRRMRDLMARARQAASGEQMA